MSDWARGKISECVLVRECTKAQACLKKINEWEANGKPLRWHSWADGKLVDCEAGLNKRLLNYEHHRIEVTYADGSKERFWVGKSTGVMPCHLEIKRRDSTGGTSVYLPDDATFRAVAGPDQWKGKR